MRINTIIVLGFTLVVSNLLWALATSHWRNQYRQAQTQLAQQALEIETANARYAELSAKRAVERTQEEHQATTEAVAQVRTEYRTIKEKVYVEVPVPADCAGAVPDRVQNSLSEAVSAANRAR